MAKAKNKHIGSSLDELLYETGEQAEIDAAAIKKVIAWQVQEMMKAENISKTEMAKRMDTSRSALDRLLNPANTSVTLHTLDAAARALGKRLRLELV
jgi:DNA-binding Xre family transcriptional regulator